MHPRKNKLFRYLVPAITLFGAVVGWNSPSEAYVQQFVIDSTNTANYSPIPLGSSTPSAAVGYTIYTGRIFGVLDPNNSHNSIITDINHAAPVVSGSPNISYIANFSIVTPTNPAARNGLVIHEVPNRGGNAISTGSLIAGVTYVQSGWQGDLLSQCSGGAGALPASAYPCVSLTSPYGTASGSYPFFTAPTGLTDWVVQVPVATSDGTAPNGTNTITGPVYSHIKTGSTGTTAQMVIYSTAFTPYQPASMDTNQANFWYETSQTTYGVDNGGPTPISGANWSWAYCPSGPPGTPNPNWICLTNGATFNSSYLYEMEFQAANPLVQGVGYAATRDFDSFLRYGTNAPGGGSNPIAGTVTREMSIGVSQDGAYIRGFLLYGFNQDEDGRIVWDGAWPQIDGRILWLNVRWSQPNTLSNLYTEGFEAPVWWSDYPNQARNLPAASILDACNSTQTCPQILETFGSNEFFNNKQGADMVGFCTTCTADIPLPANVYRYYTQGDTHGGGSISFNWSAPPTTPVSGSATYPNSPVPSSYTNNALQADFIGLLMNGTAMPPSFGGPGGTYPTLASGELAPALNQAAVGFPSNIPGFPYGGNQAWPPFVYNFGPDINYTNQTGIPTIVPPSITEIATAYVPTVNADGNETGGGLPTVLNQAPLGTYVGWNIIPPGSPYTGQQVQLTGGYWPFWDTKANRFSHNDPRLSLEERYGSHLGYNCVVRQAVNNNIAARFLLPSDGQNLITLASAGSALKSFTPVTADTSLANTLCDRDSHDFNGDGYSDILWSNTSTGSVAIWLMDGAQIALSNAVATVPSNWSVAGTRDFNGDGDADILWLDTAGDVGIWLMNGTTVSSFNGLGNVGTQWTVSGTGDFNGDGVGDILWRNTSTGDVAVWLMSNGQLSSGVNLGVVPAAWQVAGTGDFNGDGVTDILWRNTSTGALAIWYMSNGQFSSGANVGTVPLTWTVVGTGDFNGDGVADVLWRDTAGDLAVWLMNNSGGVASSSTLSGVPTTWSVAETGDFDGNGKSDILWLDNAGDVAVWFMNGLTVSSQAGLGNVGTSWQVKGQNAD